MAWKDLAERLQSDVQKQQHEIANLQRQLAESQEQVATSHYGHGHPQTGQVQQVATLQNQLQAIRAERDSLAKENASLNETLQNTITKLHKVEPETSIEIKKLNEEIGKLQAILRDKEEQVRMVQAQRSSDQSLSARETGLREEVSKLKTELEPLKAENARLRRTNESLSRQLDVEKRENTNRLGFMKSDPNKAYNQDDEEALPTGNATLKRETLQGLEGVIEPKKVFKRPFIPDHLKASAEGPKKPVKKPTEKPVKTPAPRKRKRTKKDDLDEEMADLEIENFKAPFEPRRKRPATFQGSYARPVEPDGVNNQDDDEDDDDLPATEQLRKKKNKHKTPPNTTTKSTITTNTAAVKGTAPLTPVSSSPPSSPFELPDLDFAFKAICTYHPDGQTPHNVYWPEDLAKMTELHDRINLTTELWERCAGEDWKWEYETRTRKAKNPACVTKKLQKQRSNWRPGFEGTHACRDCAKAGRPCFTYAVLERDGEHEYGEFRLLPLHDVDRKEVVVRHKEIRYWINDGVKLVDEEEDDGQGMEWE